MLWGLLLKSVAYEAAGSILLSYVADGVLILREIKLFKGSPLP